MVMERINDATLRKLQSEYVCQFCRIKVTDVVNICRNESTRYRVVDTGESLATSKKRRPAVYRGGRDLLRFMNR